MNSNIYYDFYTLWDLVDDKMKKKAGIKKHSLVEILNIPDIAYTAKTGPGSKMVDRVWSQVWYFGFN